MKSDKIFLSAIILLLIFSCKKEKKTPEAAPVVPVVKVDYEMLRISKPNWLIYKVDVSGTDFWQIPGLIQTCTKDDTYHFYTDSILTCYENKNVCAGNADSSRSKWKFIDGRKKIEATLFGNTDTADILSLTDTTMELFINYSGTPANVFFKKK